jgi:hypothetical protein
VPKPRNLAILVTATIAIFASFNAVRFSRAEGEASDNPPPESANLFEGKIVSILVKGSDSDSTPWLHKVKIVQIQDQKFLVGETYMPDTDAFREYADRRGIIAGVALNQVTQFKAYSEEQYLKYLEAWQKRSKSESDSNVEKF